MAITYKTNVVEDVLKVIEHINDTKISKPIMTIYEFDKIIALRTQQIASGAPLFIDNITTDVKSNMELRQIALKELTEGRLPFMIERKLPNNKKEYYRVRDLDLVAIRDRIR
jgi:DNA-directed RNA polymerase subunit K/omega